MAFSFQELRRLREILTTFHRNGCGGFIQEAKLLRYVAFHRRIKRYNVSPKNIRIALEELGPAFVKFGQMASLRPDVFPKDYIEEFSKMQDSVEPFAFKDVKAIVRSEMGHPISHLFRSFEIKPIASASVSQVHRAVLKNGTVVAVKIQRPGINEEIKQDGALLAHIAELIDRHVKGLRAYRLPEVVKEFRDWSVNELDFLKEMQNADLFRENASKHIVIPRMYPALCTSKVLVMEFLDGMEFHDINRVKRKYKDMKTVVENAYKEVLQQVFNFGFFHADPHPGNILVISKTKLGFVDFGIVGHFDKRLRKQSLRLFMGIIENDIDAVIFVLKEFGGKNLNSEEFRHKLSQVISELQHTSIKDVHVSRVLQHLFAISADYHVKFPQDFILFAKTVITLEGVALQYDSSFKIVPMTKPFLQTLMRQEMRRSFSLREMKDRALKYSSFIDEVPTIAREAAEHLRSGSFDVHVDSNEIRRITTVVEHSSLIIGGGIIAASLFLGSIFLYERNINSNLSVIGIGVAVVLMVWVLHHIYKNRGEDCEKESK